MSGSTCLESMYKFCADVVHVFGKEYLREPNVKDTAQLLSINESRAFYRMIDNIDCIHSEWRN